MSMEVTDYLIFCMVNLQGHLPVRCFMVAHHPSLFPFLLGISNPWYQCWVTIFVGKFFG